jgi:FkbM family methyltransferase
LDPRTRAVRIPGVDRTLHIEVHPDHDLYISEGIAATGAWEPFETELVRRLVRPGQLFVDCGANIGWYSMAVAGLDVDVLAFEPEPRNLRLLRRNLEANGLAHRVDVRPCAAGAAPGVARLQRSSDNQGDHRMAADPVGDTLVVDVVRLDDVIGDRPVAVLKLDTQGSEVAILRGARRTLAAAAATPTSVLLEYWPHGLATCGASAEELISLLAPLVGSSHRCYEVIETTAELRPRSLADLAAMALDGDYSPEGQGHTNLLVIPTVHARLVADLVAAAPAGPMAPAGPTAPPASAPVPLEHAESIRLELDRIETPRAIEPGQPVQVVVTVANGTPVPIGSTLPHPVQLAWWWTRDGGGRPDNPPRSPQAWWAEPGEERSLVCRAVAPVEPGSWTLVLGLVQESVRWMDGPGSPGRLDLPGWQVR